MAQIQCCGALHKCRVFMVESQDGFFETKLYLIDECPVCGNYKLEMRRIDYKHELVISRWKNIKARKVFDRLKLHILFEINRPVRMNLPASSFYLPYSDRGQVKKCYSNLRTLQMGLFDPYDGLKEAADCREFRKVI